MDRLRGLGCEGSMGTSGMSGLTRSPCSSCLPLLPISTLIRPVGKLRAQNRCGLHAVSSKPCEAHEAKGLQLEGMP